MTKQENTPVVIFFQYKKNLKLNEITLSKTCNNCGRVTAHTKNRKQIVLFDSGDSAIEPTVQQKTTAQQLVNVSYVRSV